MIEAGGSFTGRDQVRPRLGLPRAQRFGRKPKLTKHRRALVCRYGNGMTPWEHGGVSDGETHTDDRG